MGRQFEPLGNKLLERQFEWVAADVLFGFEVEIVEIGSHPAGSPGDPGRAYAVGIMNEMLEGDVFNVQRSVLLEEAHADGLSRRNRPGRPDRDVLQYG